MSIRISMDAARGACDSITAKINAGTEASKLVVYSGARPTNPTDAITTQVKLIEFDLPDPAFGAATEVGTTATAIANAVDPSVALADGTASFFRIIDGDGNPVFDGDVSNTAGTGDLKLSATSVIAGIDVTVISLSSIMPTR